MVTKKKNKKREETKGLDLDDAFGDDEDVEYAESKPRKNKKKKDNSDEKVISKKSPFEDEEVDKIVIKASKPVSQLKKGDKIKVDDLQLEVDAHYVLIDHGSTKEMVIDVFDPKKDKDYELRYFSDQVETSIEFYALEEIIYNKIRIKKVEW